jgi:ankyrin repeat protein
MLPVSTTDQSRDPLAAFIEAACVPLEGGHGAGTLEEAEVLLAEQPLLADQSPFAAAVVGDDAAIRRALAADRTVATARGGPRGWDALTYLCFSRYLRLAKERSAGLLRSAALLLDQGADPNSGFDGPGQKTLPGRPRQSVLYGAAGIAHHAALTQLLLSRGADPNDGETAYHAPETLDNGAVRALVASGKLTPGSSATLLHRKLDWRDYDGFAWLLEQGVDPNHLTSWGRRALHHALGRTSPLRYFERLLDHSADPRLPTRDGSTAYQVAARMGRADVLTLFERRGFIPVLSGDDAFLAACARADAETARRFVSAEPALVARLQGADPALLADFAGAGNTGGVRLLLELGFDVASRTDRGGRASDTALHVAVWHYRPETVALLVARGAPLEATNRRGDTPLSCAVRALLEQSDWTPHESPDIVLALLGAGAEVDRVPFPTGSASVDEILTRHGRAAKG